MRRSPFVVAAVLACFQYSSLLRAEELTVDPNADGKPGTFKTIAEALKAAKGSDTVTIRGGVYRESIVVTQSGTADAPTIVRGAPGERVVISGFAPITDWKPLEGGVYTATVDEPVTDLFVGLRMQSIARWPDAEQPMRYLGEANGDTFKDAAPLSDPLLQQVAAARGSAMVFLFLSQGNFYRTLPLAELDAATATVKVDGGTRMPKLTPAKDRYQIVNHPALIRAPGQWAFESTADGGSKLYFRPADPADLQSTQFRAKTQRLVYVGKNAATVSHVRIENLEIRGSGDAGINIRGGENVTIANCLVHSNAGLGIGSRTSNNTTVRNNVVMANGNGVSIVSAKGGLVEQNEIALNMVDGLIVAGNVSGRPGGEPETDGVTVRQNYIHHHLLMGHPDNMQTYRGVKNLTIADNVFLFGGQGLMSEETEQSKISNTVIVGTGAVAVIFGHANAHEWTVEQSTIGLGGYGAISMTGKGYRTLRNTFFNNALGLGQEHTSDRNLYAITNDAAPMFRVTKPKFLSYNTPADVAAATGQEKNSVRTDDPKFRGAPIAQAVIPADDQNELNRLFLRDTKKTDLTEFAVGDHIEINGDGVLRKVTVSDGKSVTFDPPLPAKPFRMALLWNWGKATSVALDLRPGEGSPALGLGSSTEPIGATLDIPAFQKGDFNGDGQRDIPVLPDDVKTALPSPNLIVMPLFGA